MLIRTITLVALMLNLGLISCSKKDSRAIADAESTQDLAQEVGTHYTITKVGDRFFLQDSSEQVIFPIGLNHLHIHHLQEVNEKYQGLSEDELNVELYNFLTGWGFNCSGYDRVITLNKNHDIYHYITAEVLAISSYHGEPNYVDVFAPETVDLFDEKVAPLAKYNDDPNVIAAMYSDIPEYLPEEERNWIAFYRQLPASAPGKVKYLEFLSQEYKDRIDDFNTIYHESIQNIDELDQVSFSQVDPANEDMLRDDTEFLNVIYRKYIEVLHQLHKKHVPKLLFFGDRYGKVEWTDDMLKIAGEYVDAIAMQPDDLTFDHEIYARIHELSQKPLLICDHKISFNQPQYEKIQGEKVETEELAGQGYETYVKECFNSPYTIGYIRCMFKSRYRTGGVLKQGLLSYEGEPHKTLIEYVTRTNNEIQTEINKLNQDK